MFWDPNPKNSIPDLTGSTYPGSVDALLDSTALGTGSTVPLIFSPYSRQFTNGGKPYKIVYDKWHTVVPQTISGFTPATGATAGLTSHFIHVSYDIPL